MGRRMGLNAFGGKFKKKRKTVAEDQEERVGRRVFQVKLWALCVISSYDHYDPQ